MQDIKLAPKIEVSRHEDDQELSIQGYGSCDKDEDHRSKILNTRLADKDGTSVVTVA